MLPKANAVVTGDALVTGHPLSKRIGVQMLPAMFHSSPDGIREALQVLSEVDAALILRGHGPALRTRLTDAIAGVSAS